MEASMDPGVVVALCVFGFMVLVAIVVAVVVVSAVSSANAKQEDTNED